jgi:outer membrane receptor protein involved in Fe transport
MQVTLGADIMKNFRVQATLDHSSGFNVAPSAILPQSHVGSFDTVNLFLKYSVEGQAAMLKNLGFTLNVNNVLSRSPPVYKLSTGDGYDNGFTVGRLVMLGVSDKF